MRCDALRSAPPPILPPLLPSFCLLFLLRSLSVLSLLWLWYAFGLVCSNPESIVSWFSSVLTRDHATLVLQKQAYNRWLKAALKSLHSQPPPSSSSSSAAAAVTLNAVVAFDCRALCTVLDRLHALLRIGETLLAVRRFPTHKVESMVVQALLARKHLQLKVWLLQQRAALCVLCEDTLSSALADTYRYASHITCL